MTRRASLPGASELFFRNTAGTEDPSARSASSAEDERARAGGVPPGEDGHDQAGGEAHSAIAAGQQSSSPSPRGDRKGSPRKKHDTKITVYISQEELLALEHARLELRGTYDLAIDRGRLVREAVAVMLSDFELQGGSSVLVERLSAEDEHDSS